MGGRALVFAAVWLVACGGDPAPRTPRTPKTPVEPAALPPAGSDLAGDCPVTASTSAADALADGHPCRDWVAALWGRVVTVGNGKSGTIWYTTARQSGVVVSCQHCFSGGAGLRAPGGPEPAAAIIGAGPVIDTSLPGGAAIVGQPGDGRTSRYRHGYLLYAPAYPASAADASGNLSNIAPADDWVVTAMSGQVVEVPGHLFMLPPSTIPAEPLAVHDPGGLLGVEVTASPVAGELALTLGYPNAGAGKLMFTANVIRDDATAADIISRAEAVERAHPYNPTVEFVMAGQLTAGNSGGAVFDRRGRYLGVMVRGSVEPVDGAHFVRVVRATYIRAELERALAAAEPSLRDAVAPFVTRAASPAAAP